MLQKDERELLQLNLFCKTRFRDLFKGINDKIIFINNENEIDLFFYNDFPLKKLLNLIDLN